ncbi:MAG: TonB-dependent receptor [candidate division KSB1 bacterium]|nr:TonB-dependent receptor [candidate division KSB1 bacterium]MDZ7300648.1 TonB-dependent receptor [candidate division KSB1 bacterium]MDZ7309785.1 TonB-dependent receptor [candidate division KSB1 bacterium]
MKTKSWCVILSLTTVFAATLGAQDNNVGTIRGSVIDDSTASPIEFVNVVLRMKEDSTIVTGTVTNQTGKFDFTEVPAGQYFITFSMIGYKEKQTPVFLIDLQHKHLNLGKVRLVAEAVPLGEVQVTAEKALYNATIDRKVYNVDQDLMSKAGSASELLQNIPSVQVDIDGNVSLRGSSNVLIMLNGRTSPLMKKNSATVLQQMPANSLDRIEVITNPSAKYKPDGTSGIINIVLKKNTTLGINGNIAGNVGNQDRYNGNARLNYNPGAFNLHGSYGIRKDSRNRINTDNRLQTTSASTLTFYHETASSYARPLSHMVSFGIDYRPDGQNKFGLSGDYFHNRFTRTESADKLLHNSDRILINQYRRNRIETEFEKEYSVTGFFEHNFPREDHTLRLEFSAAGAPEQEDNRYTNVYLLPAGANEYDNTLSKNDDNNRQLTLEYSNPLTEKSNLEVGYLGEFIGNDFDFHAEYFDATQQKLVTDVNKTNRFLYDESIHALYATYQQSLGSFGFMAGLRTEHASVRSNLVTLDSIITNRYFSWYPTLHLSHQLSKLAELQLSYSRRTRRPEGDELNPFPEYRDPRNVSAGNPKLLPEYVHSLELGCQFQNGEISILPALFYRHTYNRFTSVTQALNDTTLMTTRQNLSSDQSGGLEVVVSANLGDFITVHGNANAFRNQIDASNLGYSNKKSITTWSGNCTVDMNLSGTSRLQINSKYNSSRLTPQGKQAPSYVVNTGFRQELLGGKFFLVLTITDVFKTLRREFELNTPSLSQTVVNKRDSRIMYLSVTYRFGAQPKKSKEEQIHYDDNP